MFRTSTSSVSFWVSLTVYDSTCLQNIYQGDTRLGHEFGTCHDWDLKLSYAPNITAALSKILHRAMSRKEGVQFQYLQVKELICNPFLGALGGWEAIIAGESVKLKRSQNTPWTLGLLIFGRKGNQYNYKHDYLHIYDNLHMCTSTKMSKCMYTSNCKYVRVCICIRIDMPVYIYIMNIFRNY